MKRQGALIEKIAEIDNLYLAWIKAKKGKQNKPSVVLFEQNIEHNLLSMQNDLLSGNIDVGNYNYFKIYDPKERTICAASFPERVLHHAIMAICANRFEKNLIDNTFATRKNKGTYAALDKAKKNAKKYKWVAKLDVKKYFDNINHFILNQNLTKLFKDPFVLSIFDKIIRTYETKTEVGLPIGNLTSQYFANYYLSKADHYAQEHLKVGSYIRYMDDILIFENNKNDLQVKVQKFINFVKKELELEFKPIIITKTSKGVNFLGYKIYPYLVKLNKRSKKRFIEKFKEYESNLKHGYWTQREYQEHILPLFAFVMYADTLELRKNIIGHS